MKNILFIITLLLGNQVAFGMYNGTVKTILNPSEIHAIQRIESQDSKSYVATLKNGEMIYAYFFTKGPMKGSFSCAHNTYKNGHVNKILLNDETYDQLRNLYEAQKN